MIPEALSPLRQRMTEDMAIRQFGEHTQRDYMETHKCSAPYRVFAAFMGELP